MRWIFILFFSILLSACLYVEGEVIEEPKDVVVRNIPTKFASWEQYATVDVSDEAKR